MRELREFYIKQLPTLGAIMISSNFWSFGLLKTVNDAKSHLISSDVAVVINDKYPKAKKHFLVLPKEDIPTIFDLKPQHLSLLDELHLLALNIIEIKQEHWSDFKIGFHAEPSMQRLHLHVISKDFVSDSLKTKKHWNSFNTAYFRPYADIYEELKEQGTVRRFNKQELSSLLNTDLICNQCDFVAKTVPKLKEHLLEHWKEKFGDSLE